MSDVEKPLLNHENPHSKHEDHSSSDEEVDISLETPVECHQTLGSLRIFWSVIWLSVVEFIILLGVFLFGVYEEPTTKKILCILQITKINVIIKIVKKRIYN